MFFIFLELNPEKIGGVCWDVCVDFINFSIFSYEVTFFFARVSLCTCGWAGTQDLLACASQLHMPQMHFTLSLTRVFVLSNAVGYAQYMTLAVSFRLDLRVLV